MVDTSHIDTLALIESYGVDLQRRGSRHIGLCPFHTEKDPSFTVFHDGGWKCFGCGEAGDCISFVQKMTGGSFQEALAQLGISDRPVTREVRQNIAKRKRAQIMEVCFRGWLREACEEVGVLVRCSDKVLRGIRTEADLMRRGGLYHGAELWRYHFYVLTGPDEAAKRGLWKAGYYG